MRKRRDICAARIRVLFAIGSLDEVVLAGERKTDGVTRGWFKRMRNKGRKSPEAESTPRDRALLIGPVYQGTPNIGDRVWHRSRPLKGDQLTQQLFSEADSRTLLIRGAEPVVSAEPGRADLRPLLCHNYVRQGTTKLRDALPSSGVPRANPGASGDSRSWRDYVDARNRQCRRD